MKAIGIKPIALLYFLAVCSTLMGGHSTASAQNIATQASISDLDQLEGCSETEVRNAKISDNSFPTDDRNKIFFLYNVKTGLLLNAGGYWGTHV